MSPYTFFTEARVLGTEMWLLPCVQYSNCNEVCDAAIQIKMIDSELAMNDYGWQ